MVWNREPGAVLELRLGAPDDGRGWPWALFSALLAEENGLDFILIAMELIKGFLSRGVI